MANIPMSYRGGWEGLRELLGMDPVHGAGNASVPIKNTDSSEDLTYHQPQRPSFIGMDFADQEWLHSYQRKLGRERTYRKILSVIKWPLRLFGYREVDPHIYDAGKDVLPYLAMARAR